MKCLVIPLISMLATAGYVSAGCTDGGNGGCGVPVGEKWDTWSMRASTYTYCYKGCAVDWLYNNTDRFNLSTYAGVVGVDHYWTYQGMPCVDGQPKEFSHQDELSMRWKAKFPEIRMLQYRILSAVPYDPIVQNKITSDPNAVVRWRHEPGSTASGNGSVCYNYKSACFNDPTRINNPLNKCSFPIHAAAYNWSNPAMADWFLQEVVSPAMNVSDGIWLDGIGPDNGAYMCAGVCCGYDATNSPLNQDEIDAHCDAQTAATTKVQKWLIANGGWEAMKCFDYMTPATESNQAVSVTSSGTPALPSSHDSPEDCAKHLQDVATWASNHSNYNHVVAYGERTGGQGGYNDDTVAGTVAAFLLFRGQHFLFSIGPNGGDTPKSPRLPKDTGTLEPATARVLLSDYGKPLGPMTAVTGKTNVFQRQYEKATISLDCNSWTPTFDEHL